MDLKDEYAEWAQSYDRFGSITEIYESEKNFLKSIFDKYKIKSALDCACGTGPHLYLLLKRGIKVCGSDYSEAMLNVCNKNLSKSGIKVIIKRADFRYLEQVWNEKFDAVLCMGQSIAHLHTKEDLITAFKSMRNRLNNNGILIMTQGTTHLTLQDKFRFDLVVNNKNLSRILVRDIEKGFQTFNYIDVYHNNKRAEMKIYSIHQKIILDDDYRLLLSYAGFSKIYIYGGYDMVPYDKEKSWRLIVIAEK
ncbi:MAG: class I SAM-dependent methyltransferase [Syntrophomonadaceae bacterium]|nr:class I SAM-dependent methyltransferase [Syntrophomonadaceae bacterium]